MALEWIERHCVIPDGFRFGQPFRLYEYQQQYLSNFYLVRGDAVWVPENPVKSPAFVYRQGMMVGPQKLGKDPMVAGQICLEAVGPALFGGWAGRDEGYVCSEHHCGCGWEYAYDPGEAKGLCWPTPLVQVAAMSADATDNTYSALRPMIQLGPLKDVIPKTGEDFIRLPNGGEIVTVTAEAKSRLGARGTHISAGELGIFDKASGMDKVFKTMTRNASGIGGRLSGTSNAWDPAQKSMLQVVYELEQDDVYIQFQQAPASLSFTNKEERRRIFNIVYPPDTRVPRGHIDLDSIEAEAASLLRHDPAEAARFFGNRIVTGSGEAVDIEAWNALRAPNTCTASCTIVLGFDGSKSGDHTALIATCVLHGYQWPLGIWDPTDYGGRIPVDDVDIAVADAFSHYTVWRLYGDPPYWKDELASWAGKYGEDVVKPWHTSQNRKMADAVRAFATAIGDRTLHHDGSRTFAAHIGNAHKRALLDRDEQGEHLWTIQKASLDSALKIDAAVAAVLSWVARTEAVAAGVGVASVYELRGLVRG